MIEIILEPIFQPTKNYSVEPLIKNVTSMNIDNRLVTIEYS